MQQEDTIKGCQKPNGIRNALPLLSTAAALAPVRWRGKIAELSKLSLGTTVGMVHPYLVSIRTIPNYSNEGYFRRDLA